MIVCPSCGQENPEGFRFCGACATPLGELAATREERKVVTALFCDLVGSTAQGERLDPEDVQAMLSRYHGQVGRELATRAAVLLDEHSARRDPTAGPKLNELVLASAVFGVQACTFG